MMTGLVIKGVNYFNLLSGFLCANCQSHGNLSVALIKINFFFSKKLSFS